jgi:hypothetical protein
MADVVARPGAPAVFHALVREAGERLADDGAAVVRALAPPGSEQYRAFRTAGFWPSRHRFSVHAVLLDPEVPEADLRQPAHWSLAGGDFDVV